MAIATLPPDPFPPTLRFVDVDPAELAAEATRPLLPEPRPQPEGAWAGYLARLLPPVHADDGRQAGALRGAAGVADFLASLGPEQAAAMADSLDLIARSGFWRGVRAELRLLTAD